MDRAPSLDEETTEGSSQAESHTPPVDVTNVLRFATDDLPIQQRHPYFREEFARRFLGLDIEPTYDDAFYSETSLLALPNVSMIEVRNRAQIVRRASDLLADGNDALFLYVNLVGTTVSSQSGREEVLRPGDAVFMSAAETFQQEQFELSKDLVFSLPRKQLRELVPGIEDMVGVHIPRDTPTLRLLEGYASAAMAADGLPLTPALQQTVASHILDLVVLVAGANGDAAQLPSHRGLRAVRLHAIKRWVKIHLTSPALSVNTAAAAFGVSPRSVQLLFESEGTTFTRYVLNERLALAHRRLSMPGSASRTITEIAYDCGFTDISYFNRSFRKTYGETPSGVRQQSLCDYRR
ncbi:helix-turn-helix domain-containing protein [Aquamicrobium defluvii]|uniref:AraC family transcriptional regulator n=1 Tax=Aquamicrobium defluvii TaxID=69279 RepID=A0A011VQD4_9HYPH|nr:helix-turn-helix domain-containing protein [Aquamicrobium defluvii]EXL10590.1 AraC family transcriptional regulator [Aquamicrobium defluvii]EZQ17769.1 AraC family transcriptional regulator [Halopseudomonas bauzanensis]